MLWRIGLIPSTSCVANCSVVVRRSCVVPGRLRLHYAGRSRASFNVEHLVRDPASDAPLLAYAYKTLRQHNALRTPSRTNEPSSKADITPYYAGLLIAMAQAMAKNNYVEPNYVSNEPPSLYVRTPPNPRPIFRDILFICYYSSCPTNVAQHPHVLCPALDHKSLVLYSAAISRSYLECFDDPHQPMLEGIEITRLDVPVRDGDAFLGVISGVLRLHDLLRRRNDGEQSGPNDISPLSPLPPLSPTPHQSKPISNDDSCNTGDDDNSDLDAIGGHTASGSVSQ